MKIVIALFAVVLFAADSQAQFLRGRRCAGGACQAQVAVSVEVPAPAAKKPAPPPVAPAPVAPAASACAGAEGGLFAHRPLARLGGRIILVAESLVAWPLHLLQCRPHVLANVVVRVRHRCR